MTFTKEQEAAIARGSLVECEKVLKAKGLSILTVPKETRDLVFEGFIAGATFTIRYLQGEFEKQS